MQRVLIKFLQVDSNITIKSGAVLSFGGSFLPAAHVRCSAGSTFDVPNKGIASAQLRQTKLKQNDQFARGLSNLLKKLLKIDSHRVFIELESTKSQIVYLSGASNLEETEALSDIDEGCEVADEK